MSYRLVLQHIKAASVGVALADDGPVMVEVWVGDAMTRTVLMEDGTTRRFRLPRHVLVQVVDCCYDSFQYLVELLDDGSIRSFCFPHVNHGSICFGSALKELQDRPLPEVFWMSAHEHVAVHAWHGRDEDGAYVPIIYGPAMGLTEFLSESSHDLSYLSIDLSLAVKRPE